MFQRLVWAKLRLFFKMLELFVKKIVAQGVTHQARGIMVTRTERCQMKREFPVQKVASKVRKFLGTIGITRN